jgi:hypothetical protein
MEEGRMRKIGLILVLVGIFGYVVSTSRSRGFESVEGRIRSAFSQSARSDQNAWDLGRWAFAGVGVVGLVLVLLPGRREG